MILFRGQPLPARYSAARGRRGLTAILPDAYISPAAGRMAEWLCNGLQIRVQRFDSASGLHRPDPFYDPQARFESPRCRSVAVDVSGYAPICAHMHLPVT